ncbi:hypothetical protein CCP4SC76_1220005 [Gammaproteobacteria bacterium]
MALIIGNAAYRHVPKLANPVNDAKDFAGALRRLGFEVEEQEDVGDNRKMRDIVRRFGEKLRGGGVGLFYYSGHGIQVNGENYLIPIGAELRSEADVEYETMRMKYVQSTLADAKNGMNIIILDACRDNPFARSIRSTKRGVGEMRGLAQMDSVSGSLIAFSTAPGDTAEDGSGRNGTYTKHLLAHIGTPGLSVETVFKRVRVGVTQDTNNHQTPWESSSLTGEFCFAGCTDVTASRRETELQQEVERQKKAAAEAEDRRIKAEQELRQAGQAQAQSLEAAEKSRQLTNTQTAEEVTRLRAELEKTHHQAEENQAAADEKVRQTQRLLEQAASSQQNRDKDAQSAEVARLRTELEKTRRQAEESQATAERARQAQTAVEQAASRNNGADENSKRALEAEMQRLRTEAEKARSEAEANQAAAKREREQRERAEREMAGMSAVTTPRQQMPRAAPPSTVGF